MKKIANSPLAHIGTAFERIEDAREHVTIVFDEDVSVFGKIVNVSLVYGPSIDFPPTLFIDFEDGTEVSMESVYSIGNRQKVVLTMKSKKYGNRQTTRVVSRLENPLQETKPSRYAVVVDRFSWRVSKA